MGAVDGPALREAILDLLASDGPELSTTALRQRLSGHPSHGTLVAEQVYRSLRILVDAGAVRRARTHRGTAYWRLSASELRKRAQSCGVSPVTETPLESQ